jgi:hypothetical protein
MRLPAPSYREPVLPTRTGVRAQLEARQTAIACPPTTPVL